MTYRQAATEAAGLVVSTGLVWLGASALGLYLWGGM